MYIQLYIYTYYVKGSQHGYPDKMGVDTCDTYTIHVRERASMYWNSDLQTFDWPTFVQLNYILCIYYVYIMYILCIYYVYIMYILCIYYVYIMYILCIYYVYIMYVYI